MRLATDTGGTFTDLAVETADGLVSIFKAPTVPEDPVQGVLDALQLAADAGGETLDDFLGRASVFIHGTTHALNAVVEGQTARTALLVTQGHRDILLLREGGRADPFDHRQAYPVPYVPRHLTFGVPERILHDGSIHLPLDESAVRDTIDGLRKLEIEAVAVSLLWSIANPAHELRIAQLLDAGLPGVPYTLGHRLNPTPREYRRANAAAINAALRPLMSRYMAGLTGRLRDHGFSGRVLVLTSGGGLLDAADVAGEPVRILNSGPSVAPVAGRHYASVAGAESAIIADTGGTTYDVSLVREGRIPVTQEMWLGTPLNSHLLGLPTVDIRSIGAGGGSIASVDAAGLLRVGPQSAGARPGPACYGRGGSRATVTDAAVVLGFLDPESFLGGRLRLDAGAAEQAIMRDVGDPLRLDPVEAAAAILKVTTENMVQAIEDIVLAQGLDAGRAVLVGGGGAAGLNSVYIARRLGIRRLLFPETGATLSAAGALLSDLKADYGGSVFASTRDMDWATVNALVSRLAAQCRDFEAGPGEGAVSSEIRFVAEARYENQVWCIDVPFDAVGFPDPAAIERFRTAFHAAHKALFTIEDPRSEVEIVAVRATVACRMSARGQFRMTEYPTSAAIGIRQVSFPGYGTVAASVLQTDRLPFDKWHEGPAILETPFTSIVIDPAARFVRHGSGNIEVAP